MLCSCSKQGWQLTEGCDTLLVHSECGSQEGGSSLRQTCCCSRSAYSSFSPALSPARGYNLTEEMIRFVPGQARPELWNSGCRLAPLHPFPGSGEQCVLQWVFQFHSISQLFKSQFLGTVVPFSIERLSAQAFSNSKFDLKNYLERQYSHLSQLVWPQQPTCHQQCHHCFGCEKATLQEPGRPVQLPEMSPWLSNTQEGQHSLSQTFGQGLIVICWCHVLTTAPTAPTMLTRHCKGLPHQKLEAHK